MSAFLDRPPIRGKVPRQDRRNEALRHAVEESGSGLAVLCSRWLWLGPCISYIYALATGRIYIRGAGLGHAGLGLVRSISLVGVWAKYFWNISKRGDNKQPGGNQALACCTQCTCPLMITVACRPRFISLPACLLPCLTNPPEWGGVELGG